MKISQYEKNILQKVEDGKYDGLSSFVKDRDGHDMDNGTIMKLINNGYIETENPSMDLGEIVGLTEKGKRALK